MRTMKIVGLVLFLASAFACKKDEGISNCARLEGKWLVESWVVNSEELLGVTAAITSADLEFKVLTGQQGDYTRNTYYQVGDPIAVIGAYVVNTDCNQVTLTPKDGLAEIFQFHFSGDKLVLESSFDGIDTSIEFRKE